MYRYKPTHKYGFWDVDEDGNYVERRGPSEYQRGDGGFSPGLPSWLSQHTFNRLVNRANSVNKPAPHWKFTQGPGNYEIKRYPNDPVENSFRRLARNIRKRLGRRV